MFKLTTFFITIFTILNCTVKQCPETKFSLIIDSLIQFSQIKEDAKHDEISNKKNLFKKICKNISANQKILIIEQLRRDINSSYGIIYIYDNKKIITFDQTADRLNVDNGLAYDMSGSLKARLEYLKDSTLYRIETIRVRQKFIPDKTTSFIYILDGKNHDYRFIIY